MTKNYRISNNGDTIALVKIEIGDEDAKVFVKWFGEGEWEEDMDGLRLMLGEYGIVEPL